MKNKMRWVSKIITISMFLSMVAGISMAAEAVIEKEAVPTMLLTSDLVKTADNFIVMFDSSSSMKAPFGNTGMTTMAAAKKMLKDRNAILPDLGYNAGLYLYTPFKPIYEVQPYDRDKFAAAIDRLPDSSGKPTLLQQGLAKLDGILSGLKGKTVVYIFTDGSYSKMPGSKKPVSLAKELANKHDVCFYVISTAQVPDQETLLKSVASINACSRVVSFERMYANPTYMAGGIFVVHTRVEKYLTLHYRLAELRVDNVLFEFDSVEIRSDYEDELVIVGTFLKNNPTTYVVLTGFADNVGPAEYNMALSRERAESVEDFLINNFSVDVSRIVTQWYGLNEPVADNNTKMGRLKNRRVEFMVMGLD